MSIPYRLPLCLSLSMTFSMYVCSSAPTSCAVTSVVLHARVLAGNPGTGPYTDFKVEVFGIGSENYLKRRFFLSVLVLFGLGFVLSNWKLNIYIETHFLNTICP